MRKIPTLFVRDRDGDRRSVTREVEVGCAWVVAGEGVATRKYDGTCVMFDGVRWWARREVKEGGAAPAGWVPVDRDAGTGKAVGWEPVEGSGFAEFHAEALADGGGIAWAAGTYELVGPRINRNPEGLDAHRLRSHAAADSFDDAPRDYDGLRAWLHAHPYEGIVWHHQDGRMAKLKRRDLPPPP